MSYEQNSQSNDPSVLKDSDQVIHEKGIDSYQTQVTDLNSQVVKAQSKLDEINTAIVNRQAFYDLIYDTKQKNMQDTLDKLEAEIELKKETIGELENDIHIRNNEKDSIQTDFSAQQVDLDNQKVQLKIQADGLGGIQQSLDDRQKKLDVQEKELGFAQADFGKEVKERRDSIASDELHISQKQIELTTLKNNLDSQIQLLKETEDAISAKQNQLNQDVIEARIIINQAEELKKLKVDIDSRTVQLNTQQAQLMLDINQIKTTMIAQQNKAAELRNRESAIQDAEQKIGGK